MIPVQKTQIGLGLGEVSSIRIKTEYEMNCNPTFLNCHLYNESNAEVTASPIKLDLPQDIYDSWGTDDSIITDWVCEQLGLTLV
jgi:hypothetical protein